MCECGEWLEPTNGAIPASVRYMHWVNASVKCTRPNANDRKKKIINGKQRNETPPTKTNTQFTRFSPVPSWRLCASQTKAKVDQTVSVRGKRRPSNIIKCIVVLIHC